MRGKYDDIIDLPHPVSQTRPRMSMLDRAAQFSPFAALTGYGDAINETGRWTERKAELSEEEKQELDRSQQALLEKGTQHPEIRIVFFCKDQKKQGGKYTEVCGRLKKIDAIERVLILMDGTRIALEDIREIAEQ